MENKKLKLFITIVSSIAGSFTGVYAIWEVINYLSNHTFFKIADYIPVYIIISLALSVISVILILLKNKIIAFKRKDKLDKAKRVIYDHLGYHPAYQLKYDDNSGKIYNRTPVNGNISGERQALLRVKTFNNILDSIYIFAQNNPRFFRSNVESNDFCNQLIQQCGYSCGENFARREDVHFHQNLDGENPIDGLTEVLNRWCVFDSKAGLGKFSVDKCLEVEDNNRESIMIHITLKDDFVTDGLPGNSHGKRCYFMRGYCEGVCNVLAEKYYPGYRFTVTNCKVTGCRYKHNANKTCVYCINGYPN